MIAQDQAILTVKNLRVYYWTARGAVRAVDGIDFFIRRGEVLGLGLGDHRLAGLGIGDRELGREREARMDRRVGHVRVAEPVGPVDDVLAGVVDVGVARVSEWQSLVQLSRVHGKCPPCICGDWRRVEVYSKAS
mgnify:CR=1 FL=1